MKIKLSPHEIEKLKKFEIEISSDIEYSEDEALEILEKVYDIEAIYSNYPDNDKEAYALADMYAAIADKIYKMIPED